ncbi:MAG: tRNA (adenosine(37)-N6)-threonylcarbamoyltransferase complex dimerization subunit type 1 TsaB, partial [Prochlorococcus sp.]
MTAQAISTLGEEQAYLLLALHSSSETLGVAVLDCRDPKASLRSNTFPIGRGLSNSLLNCVEELLPAASWPHLARLAVATGPGGFTGTRLTVVMARTLAQQLGCSLDGVSSFALMAPRLAIALSPEQMQKPFWIVKPMRRRGT